MKVVVTVDKGDRVHLLPEEAWTKIQELLFTENPDLDAPGRDEQIELYAKMLFTAASTAEARITMLQKKCNMLYKQFKVWLPIVRRMREV